MMDEYKKLWNLANTGLNNRTRFMAELHDKSKMKVLQDVEIDKYVQKGWNAMNDLNNHRGIISVLGYERNNLKEMPCRQFMDGEDLINAIEKAKHTDRLL